MFHEPAAVALVVDRERTPVADPVGVAAQHPDARGMEGGHPHSLGVRADKLHDATAHLVRGLVGEGDGEYPPGRHTRDDEAGDTASQDAGLPGPGTGHHDKGAALVQDRFALSRVQVRDEVCDLPRHRLCGCRGLLLLGSAQQPAAPAPAPERGQVTEEVPLVGSPCAGSSRGQRRHRTRHYRRASPLPGSQFGRGAAVTPTRSSREAWTSRRRGRG